MKKDFISVTIFFLLQIKLSAQHCNLLDSLRSFHNLKFGQNLKQSGAKEMHLLDDHTYYYESSSKKKNEKFFELLKFQNHTFDKIYILCTNADKMY